MALSSKLREEAFPFKHQFLVLKKHVGFLTQFPNNACIWEFSKKKKIAFACELWENQRVKLTHSGRACWTCEFNSWGFLHTLVCVGRTKQGSVLSLIQHRLELFLLFRMFLHLSIWVGLVEGHCLQLALFLHKVGSGNGSQVCVRLGSRLLYPLSHLLSPLPFSYITGNLMPPHPSRGCSV